jgi:uncharacterized protein DUF4349
MVRWARLTDSWRRGARSPGRWRPRRVVAVLALVVVGVVAGGVSAGLLGGRSGSPSGYDASESTSAVAPASPSYPGTAPDAASGRSSAAAPAPDVSGELPVGGSRDLVRSAQLTLDVDDPTTRARQVRTAATAVGGLVVQEQSSDDHADITVRVPAAALDELVDDVAGLGVVLDRSAQVTDATADVVDLDARVRSQQASVDRVRALLGQAGSIGDVVSIESELAGREADLDSLTGRLAALRDRVALSTLTVDLRGPQAPAVPTGEPTGPAGWSSGLAAGWAGLLAVGTAAAAVAGFLLPMLPLVAVVLGVAWVVRRIVRGRRPGAAAPPAPTPTT